MEDLYCSGKIAVRVEVQPEDRIRLVGHLFEGRQRDENIGNNV